MILNNFIIIIDPTNKYKNIEPLACEFANLLNKNGWTLTLTKAGKPWIFKSKLNKPNQKPADNPFMIIGLI